MLQLVNIQPLSELLSCARVIYPAYCVHVTELGGMGLALQLKVQCYLGWTGDESLPESNIQDYHEQQLL